MFTPDNPTILNFDEANRIAHLSRCFKAGIPGAQSARLGRCHELSARYVTAEPGTGHRCILQQGTIFNPEFSTNGAIFHSWVLIPPDPNTMLPVADWFRFDPVACVVAKSEVHNQVFNPTVLAEYSEEEVLKHLIRFKHWGPWDEAMYDDSNLD